MISTNDSQQPLNTNPERKQRGPFKKRRAGIVLSKDEVIRIKAERKKLRSDMRKMGIKDKKEFELTASSLGLYFDKDRRFALILWLFTGNGLWVLLASGLMSMLVLYGMSTISDLRGHFTISMSDALFKEGFSVSETKGFENPTSHLFSTPAEEVPCISISHIPEDVDDIDGAHHQDYFAYTFYVRNEGNSTQNVSWQLRINSESNSVRNAAWVMLFIDGKMTIYAKEDENGKIQALPAQDDNTRGYLIPPLYDKSADPNGQFEVIKQVGSLTYWRVKPKAFVSDKLVSNGLINKFEPQQTHKVTVVIWLEGDDPHCTDDLIGGHLGMDFFMQIADGQT